VPSLADQSRRAFLTHSGLGLGAVALSGLLRGESRAADATTAQATASAIKSHFAPKAKHIIYLHMIGAPSHLDLFEYKPELIARDNQPCPEELTNGKRFAFIGGKMSLAGTTFKFAKHGKSGQEMSEVLPHLAKVADDICIVKSLHTDEINHGPAQMFL